MDQGYESGRVSADLNRRPAPVNWSFRPPDRQAAEAKLEPMRRYPDRRRRAELHPSSQFRGPVNLGSQPPGQPKAQGRRDGSVAAQPREPRLRPPTPTPRDSCVRRAAPAAGLRAALNACAAQPRDTLRRLRPAPRRHQKHNQLWFKSSFSCCAICFRYHV